MRLAWAFLLRQRRDARTHLNGSNSHKTPGYEKSPVAEALTIQLAEEEGFEPSLPGLRVKRFSRPPHSTTLPPLRMDGALFELRENR